jgi:hypothetical protein
VKLTLTIPAAPWPSRNTEKGLHWSRLQERHDEWATWSFVAWHRAGRPRIGRCTVTVRLYFRTRQRRDRDNFTGASGCKGCLDGIKGRAYPDDADGVIDLRPLELLADGGDPRVEIVLEGDAR